MCITPRSSTSVSSVAFSPTVLTTAVLTIGSKGRAVRALQCQLNLRIDAFGLTPSMAVVVDGVFGPKTLTAVKYLQCVGGFPVNGQVDRATERFLAQGTVGLPQLSAENGKTRALRTCVAAVQRTILAAGVEVSVDGCFGSQTTAALESYQQQQGLSISGVVNAATWDVIVRSRLTTLPCAALLPYPEPHPDSSR